MQILKEPKHKTNSKAVLALGHALHHAHVANS
jgi:hypothetical protein